MTSHRSELLQCLIERSYRKQRVVLASGKESDFFIDCKQTALRSKGHLWIGELMLEALSQFSERVCAVAGVELGGCSLASAVATVSAIKNRPIDAVYVRKALKDHGSVKWLEGAQDLKPGDALVVLEDVITTAGTTLKAIERITGQGFKVAGVIALVDRLEGGAEALKTRQIPFVSIFTRSDFPL